MNRHHRWRAYLLLGAAIPWPGGAQQSGDETLRHLWNTKFVENRPQAAEVSAAPAAPKPAAVPKPVRPAPAAKEQEPAEEINDALVGVTLWRLRAAVAEDDPAVRMSIRGAGDWTPERVPADTPLREGQRVRISIESARAGYLYVVSREQFGDGSYGATELIFPTLRTRGGANQVVAGRLIEIPAWEDNPPFFTVRLSRPDQVAEILTVLVTPKPLPGMQIGRNAMPIAPEQVAEWEKSWGARVQRLEAPTEAGKLYTRAEKQAAAEGLRRLTQEEPVPQTMYHVESRPDVPLLLSVPLRMIK
jgi:hypothetical protein